jgi:ferredoxin
MTITIDQNKCIGCGRCTEICPKVFRLSESGKSEVIEQTYIPCVRKASDECPVEAIHVI